MQWQNNLERCEKCLVGCFRQFKWILSPVNQDDSNNKDYQKTGHAHQNYLPRLGFWKNISGHQIHSINSRKTGNMRKPWLSFCDPPIIASGPKKLSTKFNSVELFDKVWNIPCFREATGGS